MPADLPEKGSINCRNGSKIKVEGESRGSREGRESKKKEGISKGARSSLQRIRNLHVVIFINDKGFGGQDIAYLCHLFCHELEQSELIVQ